MLRIGFIGWRGMVGSVLMQRMREENDFAGLDPVFFSTSNTGGAAPKEAGDGAILKDAADLRELARCDVLISCQGGEYTSEVYGPLRKNNWKGYWIDAASTLRMSDDAVIILDPVNADVIRGALAKNIRAYIGGNCTVSLMLMAVSGLFRAGLVEWMTTMTYQAASGAGAAKMLELVNQMGFLTDATRKSPSENALEVDRAMIQEQRSPRLPVQEFGVPLAGSLIPWIDKEMPEGQTREEWKGMAETNKIMALDPPVPVDGICVRVSSSARAAASPSSCRCRSCTWKPRCGSVDRRVPARRSARRCSCMRSRDSPCIRGSPTFRSRGSSSARRASPPRCVQV